MDFTTIVKEVILWRQLADFLGDFNMIRILFILCLLVPFSVFADNAGTSAFEQYLQQLRGYPDEDEVEVHESLLPISTDLSQEAALARQNKMPILVLFSAFDCEYCQRLEKEILNPMYKNEGYRKKIIMRRVMIDHYGGMRDFGNLAVEASELAQRYKVDVTPTVIVFDSTGKPLAPKIVGLNTTELYSAYLDKVIDASYAALQ
jgi:thioredoxin-related protein